MRLAEGSALLELEAGEPGIFGEFPLGCGFEVLRDAHEAARQCPTTGERVGAASNQQHFQALFALSKYGDVHGNGGMRVVVREHS